jgi:uncharacterized membrane protein
MFFGKATLAPLYKLLLNSGKLASWRLYNNAIMDLMETVSVAIENLARRQRYYQSNITTGSGNFLKS